MTQIVDFLLNIVLNSILEEAYVVVAALLLLRMSDMIKFNRKLVISVLAPAIVSNALRYFFGADVIVVFIIFIITMILTICLLYKLRTIVKIFMAFTCISVACVSNAMLEIVNYKIIMLCTNINEVILKENIFNAFVSSLPIRVVELGIIVLYMKKQKRIDERIDINVWKLVQKDEGLSLFSIVASVFNILWIVASVKIFILDKLLVNSTLSTQTSLLVLMGAIVVPIMIYICLFFSVYNIQSREAYIDSLNKDLVSARESLNKNESYKE